MEPRTSPHLSLTKNYWKNFIFPGDVVIDATCGNGKDLLFLAKLPVKSIFAMDIQSLAIEKAKTRVASSLTPIFFYHMSHEKIDELPFEMPPKLIVYNLGYLPGSDKKVITQKESTLKSVKKGVALLAEGGALSITCYPYHEGGAEEEAALIEWATSLPEESWEVRYHKWINRPVHSPTLLWIERRSSLSQPKKRQEECEVL